MTKRVLLAGLLGGIAMYVWTAIAHMILPLGEAGIQEIPNEQAVLAVMRSSLGRTAGLYLFPGMGLGPDATRQQKQAAMNQYAQKLATNPSGILMYNPPGAQALAPRQFIAEFVKELIESLLAVFLLARTRLASYGSRLGFIVVLGIVASIGTNISYWNWYGFPLAYTAAYVATELVGFACVGLIAAGMVRTD
ncbi:MAG: hypothetical protein ACLP59_29870 [Bryobacteraceae bacterium]